MIASATLAAGFVNPALLGGLGLFLVPIIIHLLSRRHHRRVEWAAMRFLLEAEKENRRRVRFEQWLLLALRCLVMVLLALLFARPFVQPGLIASLLGESGRVRRIIVLDDSASLDYRVGTQTEFDRLRSASSRLLSWLHQEAPDDPVTFLLTSAPDEPVVSDETLCDAALDDLRARVEALRTKSTRAVPRRVMTRVAERLEPLGRQVRADLYVLSDFQRTDWLAAAEGSQTARRGGGGSVFEPIRRLNLEGVRAIMIASGVTARRNTALLDVRLVRPRTIAGLPAVVTARVVSFGGRPADDVEIRVEVDGQPLPALASEITSEPDASGLSADWPGSELFRTGHVRRLSFEVTFPDAGYSVLTVGTGPVDAFAADDQRRVAVRATEALAVLLVNGQPSTDPQRDEVYLVRNALSPPGPLSSGVQTDVIDPGHIEATDLNAYDCVLLCNVAPPGEGAVDALDRYVRRGGGVVFFLGSEIGDADEFNRSFHANGDGILPAALTGLRGTGARPLGAGLVRTAVHPVTAMFPDSSELLSEFVHFRNYYATEEGPPGNEAGRNAIGGTSSAASGSPPVVLARFNDRDRTPAIVERAVGRGRVLLFTSSVDLEWNDWARTVDGSYVVTMLEVVQYVARRSTHPTSFIAGEQLTLPLWPDRYEPSGVFRPPPRTESGMQVDAPAVTATVREVGDSPNDPVLLMGPVADRLGTYSVELETRARRAETRPLCVNLHPAESNLAVARPAELDAALAGIPHEYIAAAEDFLRGDEESRHELWPSLLLAVVCVLMIEQALARWFGTPSRARSALHEPSFASGHSRGTL